MKRILLLAILLPWAQAYATDYSVLSSPGPLASTERTEYSELTDSVDLDGRTERLLYFTADWCINCKTKVKPELDALKEAGWKIGGDPESHIQVIDIDYKPDWQRRFKVTSLPTFVMLSNEKEVRRHVGVADRNQIDKLFKGATCQPYPSRNGWWTVLGEPNPSRARLLEHLIGHPNHSGKFDTAWLKRQSYESLMSLHSDDHERAVNWDYVQGPDQKRERIRSKSRAYHESSRERKMVPEKARRQGLLPAVFGGGSTFLFGSGST